MNILVCGGAGYIGSHMAKILFERGFKVTVFDNLSTGHRDAVKWGDFVQGDLLDQNRLTELFLSNKFNAVMHFSAKSIVNESIASPDIYYMNNVVGTLNLLDAMRKQGIDRFVFSSSAAVYGNPVTPLLAKPLPDRPLPAKPLIDESQSLKPINPYGKTKLIVENMLHDYAQAYGLCSVSLRYFNAAGADPDGLIGESHNPETHLIPNILKSVLKSSDGLKVFGNNYDTPDGTCIRDYIHINDLCLAHLKALEFMKTNGGSHFFNLGNQKGFSILEIIRASENVVGKKIPFEYSPPRSGDPPTLVADSSKAKVKLNWEPEHTDLEEIIQTAWNWHLKVG